MAKKTTKSGSPVENTTVLLQKSKEILEATRTGIDQERKSDMSQSTKDTIRTAADEATTVDRRTIDGVLDKSQLQETVRTEQTAAQKEKDAWSQFYTEGPSESPDGASPISNAETSEEASAENGFTKDRIKDEAYPSLRKAMIKFQAKCANHLKDTMSILSGHKVTTCITSIRRSAEHQQILIDQGNPKIPLENINARRKALGLRPINQYQRGRVTTQANSSHIAPGNGDNYSRAFDVDLLIDGVSAMNAVRNGDRTWEPALDAMAEYGQKEFGFWSGKAYTVATVKAGQVKDYVHFSIDRTERVAEKFGVKVRKDVATRLGIEQ